MNLYSLLVEIELEIEYDIDFINEQKEEHTTYDFITDNVDFNILVYARDEQEAFLCAKHYAVEDFKENQYYHSIDIESNYFIDKLQMNNPGAEIYNIDESDIDIINVNILKDSIRRIYNERDLPDDWDINCIPYSLDHKNMYISSFLFNQKKDLKYLDHKDQLYLFEPSKSYKDFQSNLLQLI